MKKVLSILAILATVLAVSCKKTTPTDPSKDPSKDADPSESPVDNPSESPVDTPSDEPGPYVVPITIDGDFSDWAKLDESKVQSATLVAEDTWAYPELKCAKVYADELFVFVYMEFNKEVLAISDVASHYALYINGDNNSDTGGYSGQWDQGEKPCIDVLVMGDYHDGTDFVGNLGADTYLWSGEDNADGWSWTDAEVSGFCEGFCNSTGMEFALTRDLYPAGNWEDEFTMGFQLQTSGWDATGALPNTEPSDDNPSGRAPLLKVIVNK